MILSAPCATGEEACSIALSLLESGHSPNSIPYHCYRYQSARNQTSTKRHLFSRTLFVPLMKHERTSGSLQQPKGWQVASEIQETVEFLDRNLLHSHTENELITESTSDRLILFAAVTYSSTLRSLSAKQSYSNTCTFTEARWGTRCWSRGDRYSSYK